MKRLAILPLILAFAIPAPPSFAKKPAEKEEIVFPPPPNQPRIRYLRSLSRKKDLRPKKLGLFAKIARALAGGELDAPLLTRPYGVAFHKGRLFVADSEGSAIVVFDTEKGETGTFGKGATGRVAMPVGIAVDEAGRVYVADSLDRVIKAFSPEGKLLWQQDRLPGKLGKFKRPTGVAWCPCGELIVADAGSKRVVALSPGGEFLREIMKPKGRGALFLPANVWAEADGTVLVSDPILARVHLFSREGKFLFGFGEQGDSPGYLARPRGVASDSDGNIYVVDALFGQIQIFNRKGKLLLYFGGNGNMPANFLLPAGIYIDSSDRIYIADSQNRRIQVFQYLKQAPKGDTPKK